MHRREVLKASVAAVIGAGTATIWPALAAARPPHAIGLQLYTVLEPLEKDFEGTLKGIAAMGYREVETLSAFGRDPRHVRELLDSHGLNSPSQHLEAGDLRTAPDRMEPIVEEGIARARILGQKYLVLPIVWPEQVATRELMEGFCKALNLAGELCASAGLEFNFHNHSTEFEPVNGYVPYERILKDTDPGKVKLEMDVYWFAHAKQDPLKYLAAHPGRYRQMHLKDATSAGGFAAVGKGVLNFPALLRAAQDSGVEHYYVECDSAADPMQVTRDSYDYLKTIL